MGKHPSLSDQKPDGVAIPEKWLDCLRSKVIALFARNLQGRYRSGSCGRAPDGHACHQGRGRLLHAWATIVKDPREKATSLFLKGAQLVWGWPHQRLMVCFQGFATSRTFMKCA